MEVNSPMDFVCTKAALLHGIQTVSRAIPSTTTERVLLNVLLKIEDQKLSLFATDNRISIRKKIEVTTKDDGELSLPGHLFGDILQTLQTVDADEITIKTSDDFEIEISSEHASYKLRGNDPRSFPLIPAPEGDMEFTINGSLLKTIIKQIAVTGAASAGKSQGYDKALFQAAGGILTTVTTDTVRLAVREDEIEDLPDFEVMIPMHALEELAKIIDTSSEIKVLLSDEQISFSFGETEFQTRLCEKGFPDFRKIIPKDNSRTVNISSKNFSNAIKGVLPVVKDSKGKILLELENDTLIVSAQSQEGSARREISAEVTGDPLELAFNAKFILEFLSIVDSENVVMGITSSIHPATIKPSDKEISYLYLLMPIHV